MSAPADGADVTLAFGVNTDAYDPAAHTIVSNASCTTNALAPLAKVLDDLAGIEHGFMTTVHAYTQEQNLQDGPHRDPRRARAAGVNIVPTTTGAAKAIGLVLPGLDGKLSGDSIRVPVPVGSIVELNTTVSREVTRDEVLAAYRAAAEGPLAGILEYSEDPLVSSDITGNPASSIFDAALTRVDGKHVKVVAWYDNEWGFSNRVIDTLELLAGAADAADLELGVPHLGADVPSHARRVVIGSRPAVRDQRRGRPRCSITTGSSYAPGGSGMLPATPKSAPMVPTPDTPPTLPTPPSPRRLGGDAGACRGSPARRGSGSAARRRLTPRRGCGHPLRSDRSLHCVHPVTGVGGISRELGSTRQTHAVVGGSRPE